MEFFLSFKTLLSLHIIISPASIETLLTMKCACTVILAGLKAEKENSQLLFTQPVNHYKRDSEH